MRKSLTTKERIQRIQEEVTELTFDRAFGFEAQRKFEVWENIQARIIRKNEQIKALKSGSTVPDDITPL